jgi:hypothetical protein
MKKLLLVAALALTCAGLVSPTANAQTAMFTFAPANGQSLNVTAGGTFQFTINLTVSGLSGTDPTAAGAQNIQGLTYFLQQSGGSAFPFSITGRDITGSMFTDLISTQGQVFASPGNNVDLNGNERDLGALADNPMGNGTYFVATITLSIAANAAPGQYTFQSVNTGGRTAVFNDSNGDTSPIQQGMITVTVPEPSTYALLALGAIGAGVIVYRRRVTA